jgi:hypothetical protein
MPTESGEVNSALQELMNPRNFEWIVWASYVLIAYKFRLKRCFISNALQKLSYLSLASEQSGR